jgi:hypothetical protein
MSRSHSRKGEGNLPWPLVRIVWRDSSSPRGWQTLKDWGGLHSLECESVGYLIAEDHQSKTVVPHIAYPLEEENRQGSGIMVIPAGCIVSVERLVTCSSSRVCGVAGRSSRSRGRVRRGSG